MQIEMRAFQPSSTQAHCVAGSNHAVQMRSSVARRHSSRSRPQQHNSLTQAAKQQQQNKQQHTSSSRRGFIFSSASWAMILSSQAHAAQAESLTLQDVTPSIAAAGSLGAREQAVITIFESATPAVVTVFDVTLIVSATCLVYVYGRRQPMTAVYTSFNRALHDMLSWGSTPVLSQISMHKRSRGLSTFVRQQH